MGEGVDPTAMCRSLVDKVTQSELLMTIADPDLLVLFEDWLEELEEEVRHIFHQSGILDEAALASRLGVSRRGAAFLISKLAREKEKK